ncbi:hypothetical protein Tco_1422490 [Tanacetum coccineum]
MENSAAISNMYLSSKAASNDRLRKSRIDILCGMFYRENVDYPKLIWEDFAFQIDYKQLKKGRRENVPYPRFTKIIINNFLSKHQSLTKLHYLHTHIIKDDGVVSRLKFVRIGEDFLEYRLPIPETMLTEGIKQSDSYQMFIKYSTRQIPPKKSRDVALELGKSISLTEAAEEEAARQVHATHAKIMTEFVPEPTRRRPSGITFRDTSSVALKESKKTSKRQPGTEGSSEGTSVSAGVPNESTVIPATSSEGTEQESEYSEEGDDYENIEWVDTDEEEEKDDDDDDKSIDLEKTDNEETDNEFMHSEENVQDDDEETDDELVHADEQVNDDKDEEMTNAEDADTGNSDEEITDTAKVKAEKTKVEKDDIKKAELPLTSSILSISSGFGNQFLNLSFDTSLIGTVKDTIVVEINSLLDVQIQQEIPHIKSPSVLTVPVFVIFEPSVLTSIPQTPSVEPATTLLPPSTISSISHVLPQTTTAIPTPPITTKASQVTTIPDPFHAVIQRVSVMEKVVQELNEAENTTTLRALLRSEIPSAVNAYLGSSLGDALQKVLQKHTEELIQKYPQQVDFKEMIEEFVQANIINEVKNKMPKFLPKAVSDFATPVIQSTVKNALEKTPLLVDQSSSQAPSSLKAVESLCNTPKMGRSGIRIWGVLLIRSITQDNIRTTQKVI